MSVGPMGFMGAAATSGQAQRSGSDKERVAHDQSTQARQTDSSKQAAKAEGIGETEQDHEATDRDADGRRVWERTEDDAREDDSAEETSTSEHLSRDATGDRGNRLDVTG